MSIELKMPALSPTMEEGTLAKWLVKVGDKVSSGDLLAEIETDKATMEFEAIDEGVVTELLVAEGTDGVKVGTVIAVIAGEDDDVAPAPKKEPFVSNAVETPLKAAQTDGPLDDARGERKKEGPPPAKASGDRIIASPLAKRIAADKGIDLAGLTGTGPNGRIVKADLEGAKAGTTPMPAATTAPSAPAIAPVVALQTDLSTSL